MRLGSRGARDTGPGGLEPASGGDRCLSEVTDNGPEHGVDGRVFPMEKIWTSVAAGHERPQAGGILDFARANGGRGFPCRNVTDLLT